MGYSIVVYIEQGSKSFSIRVRYKMVFFLIYNSKGLSYLAD
jgi:hypothetical protein